MKHLVRAIAPVFFILLTALYGFAQNNIQRNSPADARLRAFLDKDWKYWLGEYPEFATSVGFPGENGRWTDWSPRATDLRNRHLAESLKILQGFVRSELSTEARLNYDLYKELVATATAGLRFHDDAFPLASVVPTNLYMPINQIQGLLQDVPNTIAIMPSAQPSDYQNIIARLDGVPRLVEQTIELMNTGLSHGWTPPKITMRDVPAQLESQIFTDALRSPLLNAFKKYPATYTSEQQQEFTRQATAAYLNQVTPALLKLREYQQVTYIHASREPISVVDLPVGANFYTDLMRWHTTTDLTADQIHQTGLAQVKQIRSEMDQVIADTKFQGSFEDFVKFINTDSRFTFANEDDLLRYYRDLAKRIDPVLARFFGRLPRLPYGVKPIPEAVAPSQTAGYYESGAPSAGRAGYFYVNTYNLASRPKWDAEDLTMHEAVPGHHLQISLGQEMQNVPEFRKYLGYTAFVEGWGLYAETLGSEMGFYTDPYSKFGYLSAQMWRAVRLVVDTGLHSKGWTREQATKYFAENTGQPEQNVIVEVDRYIVWPGQALGYKIGQLKIRELRSTAERALGDGFDIRAFHDTVLDEGAVPLNILEARVEQFIAAKAPKRASTKTPGAR
jgi:uncharacterized protein (DUF885 family)